MLLPFQTPNWHDLGVPGVVTGNDGSAGAAVQVSLVTGIGQGPDEELPLPNEAKDWGLKVESLRDPEVLKFLKDTVGKSRNKGQRSISQEHVTFNTRRPHQEEDQPVCFQD